MICTQTLEKKISYRIIFAINIQTLYFLYEKRS